MLLLSTLCGGAALASATDATATGGAGAADSGGAAVDTTEADPSATDTDATDCVLMAPDETDPGALLVEWGTSSDGSRALSLRLRAPASSAALRFTAHARLSYIDDAVATIDGPVLAKSSAPIGDLDGDTVPELALQGPCVKSDPALRCVYLFHGQDVVGAVELDDAWVLEGAEPGDDFGETVAAIGDVNDDGFGDVAIAAPLDSARGPYGGMVYLIPGTAW